MTKPESDMLQQQAIEFILSLPEKQQDTFSDGVQKLVDTFTDAREHGIEFNEDDMTEIFMWAFALNLYLMRNE